MGSTLTHPIIRSFFEEKFKENCHEEFKQAHLVLFEYYQKLPEKEFPDTLEEMLPLYRAVVHGCLAEEYQKALDDVYRKRIRRGDENYSIAKLSAYSQDLVALSAFFPQGWQQQIINSDIEKEGQAWLLGVASYCLMSLGRLSEAVEPRKENIKLYVNLKYWEKATLCARNFTGLLWLLGNLNEAEEVAKKVIEYAQNIKNSLAHMKKFYPLAIVLHLRGQLEYAQLKFAESELLQKQIEPDYLYLHSRKGIRYCELLLDIAKNTLELKQILERGNRGLKISEHKNLSDVALYHLMLACSYNRLQQYQIADKEFDLAIDSIQKQTALI